jgi:uncharacterized protein YdhG (YjbR/CyaY superfamily)
VTGATTATATAKTQIDAILAGLPPDQRSAMQALRETIAATAPEAEETISYAMPAFRYHHRILAYYSAFKTHCSLFPGSGAVIEAHRRELEGFVTSKGTLQFTPEHPLPTELIERIVRAKMAEIDHR